MLRIDGRFEANNPSWRIVVDVLIRPPERPTRLEQARAVVDTGANRTALSGSLADRLALPSRGKRNVLGARGMNMHNLFAFEVGFVIATAERPRFEFLDGLVQGMDWGGHPEFDVLLGMDLLCRCELTTRSDRSFSLILP